MMDSQRVSLNYSHSWKLKNWTEMFNNVWNYSPNAGVVALTKGCACTRELMPVCARQGRRFRTFGNKCMLRAENNCHGGGLSYNFLNQGGKKKFGNGIPYCNYCN
uniref:Kazal-like domain-containing protein n=1 Tax=Rhodnius prolixus TaxID=13249 RepID=T1HPE7_RHOPR